MISSSKKSSQRSSRKIVSSQSKNAWYVYIVQCADRTLYTGITVDLHKRIQAHNAGTGAKYTRSRLPVTLLYSEKEQSKSQALIREASIKQMTRKEKENLVQSKPVVKKKKFHNQGEVA